MKTAMQFSLVLVLCALPLIKAGNFWYFDDLHYDPTYGQANESCYEDTSPPPRFNPKGNYFCDAPWTLVEDSIKKMRQTTANPDFVVWAGDTGHHYLTRETVLNPVTLYQAFENVTRLLTSEFPGVRVIPLLGNHDWLPKNELPQAGQTGDLYDQYATLFETAGWLTAAEANVFRTAGYFATTMAGTSDKLRVIVLNTNLYLSANTATSGDDPAGQFEFLRDELAAAQQNNQDVYLFTHVPVGNSAIRSPYDETLIDIIIEYASVIKSMHGAHEHLDRFRLISNKDDNTPQAFQIITPAVTPWIGGRDYPRNPSFAIFEYSDTDYSIDDMTLYWLNLADFNAQWVELYKFRDTYNSGINLQSMTNLLQRLKDDESFFQEYYRRMWVNIGTNFMTSCDEDCMKTELCLIEYTRNDDLTNCLPSDNGAAEINSTYMILLAAVFALVWRQI